MCKLILEYVSRLCVRPLGLRRLRDVSQMNSGQGYGAISKLVVLLSAWFVQADIAIADWKSHVW